MHTEGEIRKAVRILVEKYGTLTTSELKQKMPEALEYDAEDRKKSETRLGEIKILQRIGNIVSHQKERQKVYDEGFSLTKYGSRAVFSAVTGVGSNVKNVEPADVEDRKRRLSEARKTVVKKVDWNAVNERRTEIGREGEKFVFNAEKAFVQSIDASLSDRVIHLSVEQGDGFGYDILSVDENGNSLYIEVKTTTENDENAPFYMSRNEYEFFRSKKDEGNTFLYRVYNFDMVNKRGKIKKISAKDLIDGFGFEPISYEVSKK